MLYLSNPKPFLCLENIESTPGSVIDGHCLLTLTWVLYGDETMVIILGRQQQAITAIGWEKVEV